MSRVRRSALVTGAAGFIGARLTCCLLSRGWEVVAYDDLSSSGSWWRLEHSVGSLRRVEGDVLDVMALERAARDADVIFHHAGMSARWPQRAGPGEWHAVNVTAVLQLLEIVRFVGASRVILSDTCVSEVIEGSAPLPLERHCGFDAISRSLAARYARHFAEHTDLDVGVLCYAEVYGPGQLHVHPAVTPVASLVRDLLDENVPLLVGDEGRPRDLVFIDDVVEANLLAAGARVPLRGQRLAIASGEAVTMRDVVGTARRMLGLAPEGRIRRSPRRPLFACCPDTRAARDQLGFHAGTPLARGLDRTITWQQLAWG